MKIYQMKEILPQNQGFGMGTKRFDILPLPKTGIVLLVFPTHFQENQNSSVQDSKS